MATEALPMTMAFAASSSKVAAPAEAIRMSVSSQGGSTFTERSRLIFNIPTGSPGSYLDPSQTYLQFTVYNNTGAAYPLDGSGYACIEQMDIFSGDQISSIKNFHLYNNFLLDHTVNVGERRSAWTLAGTADYILKKTDGTDPTLVADLLTATNSEWYSKEGISISNASSAVVCLPLIGILGSGAQRAIPLGVLRNELRIEFTLAPSTLWGISASAPGTNVYITRPLLQCAVIRLDGAVETAMLSQLGGQLTVPCMDIQCHTMSVAQNAGSMSFMIPSRVSSASSVIILFSTLMTTANAGDACVTSRANPIKSYSFRVGAYQMPQVPVDCTVDHTEARVELCRALRSLNSAANPSSVSRSQFASSGFAVGLALDSFMHQGMMLDGRDLRGTGGLLFEASLGASNLAFIAYAYVIHDKILNFSNGVVEFTT